jgi:F0F1-type ATP synthase assembly protein I
MPDQKQPNPFIKFSNLAIQMGLIIGLGAWGGHKLDQHYKTSKPVWTIVLSLLGIAAGLYVVLKDFIKRKD